MTEATPVYIPKQARDCVRPASGLVLTGDSENAVTEAGPLYGSPTNRTEDGEATSTHRGLCDRVDSFRLARKN